MRGLYDELFKECFNTEILSGKCVKCKRCLEVPHHAIFVFSDNEIRITNKDKCMECGACMKNCKYVALLVDSSIGCAEALIYTILAGKEPECGYSDDKETCC